MTEFAKRLRSLLDTKKVSELHRKYWKTKKTTGGKGVNPRWSFNMSVYFSATKVRHFPQKVRLSATKIR